MALSSSGGGGGGGSSKRASSSSLICGEVVNNYKAVDEAAVVICVVDGCGADLSDCRKYYQRHKVCEVHSKTPQVSISGQNLRFCQQCSRFHSLDEFDEGKRSCRKRLDGHNRRRRKPRPYTFSPYQGTNILQSAGPLVHQTMGLMISPLWSDVVEAPSWVDHTSYAPSLLSSSVSPSQSTLTHVMMHPHSGSSSGSGSITTGSLDQQGLVSGGLENDNCDMGWGGMTDDIDPRHGASLNHDDPQTLPFYWLYE